MTQAQRVLVTIFVNGVEGGTHIALIKPGSVALPEATLVALRLPADMPPLDKAPNVHFTLDKANWILKLQVPASLLGAQVFATALSSSRETLSSETWGGWVNYSVNGRRVIDQGATGLGSASTKTYGWGATAAATLIAPDYLGDAGWAYDSDLESAPVRLDSSLTWRPVDRALAVTGGDSVSVTPPVVAEARPFRFGGVAIGTDFSGQPGWTDSPIPSVSATAQAESAVDVFVDGARVYDTRTSGGAFTVSLPPGVGGANTSVVVTDVTGKQQILSLEAPLIDAQLISRGTFLWTAGAGAPRYGYGLPGSTYQSDIYGYANGRYGVSNVLTSNLHLEGGPGVAEAELGADWIPMRRLAIRSSVAGSDGVLGPGGSGNLGLEMAGPYRLSADLTAGAATGGYRDVVAASGKRHASSLRIPGELSLPALMQRSARLSWQATRAISLSLSYDNYRYRNTGMVSFASASVNYNTGRFPLFFNVAQTHSGRSDGLQATFGVSIQFGTTQMSASAGYDAQGGLAGDIDASQPMRSNLGSIGWQVDAQRADAQTYLTAGAETRTPWGVPGVSVQKLGGATTAYATMQGTVGALDWHPFVSGPSSGGFIIADAGLPNVPFRMDGSDEGRTGFDGKLAIPTDVVGSPRRIAIDTERLPIDVMPDRTEGKAAVRTNGATVLRFDTRSSHASTTVTVTIAGKPPPVGSTLIGADAQAPIDSHGMAFLEAVRRNEVLKVESADGRSCLVATRFDGHGGLRRKLGPLPCDGGLQ